MNCDATILDLITSLQELGPVIASVIGDETHRPIGEPLATLEQSRVGTIVAIRDAAQPATDSVVGRFYLEQQRFAQLNQQLSLDADEVYLLHEAGRRMQARQRVLKRCQESN